MSFRIEGGGGDGSGVRVWEFKYRDDFNNTDPDSTNFIELWDHNDPLKPEPTTAYVFIGGQFGWMNKASASDKLNYPPSCGAAFGFKKYLKGQIPEKVYAWRGSHQNSYPYNYNLLNKYFGFNSTPSRSGAMELPNMGGQNAFHQTDFLAADAINHHKGAWDKVYNGGNGHWFDRNPPENFVGRDGCGSSASIFGPGHDGGQYPAGSGGPGTDTARGPVAKGLAEGILTEMGLFRNFIWGKSRTSNTEGDGGEYEVHIPPGLFMFGQGPINFNLSVLQLPNATWTPDRTKVLVNADYKMIFSVMLEYR